MNETGNGRNLIDLLSEQHLVLRKRVAELDRHGLNKTESHILSLLENASALTASEISRIIGISRQGAHKCLQGLEEQGFVAPVAREENGRDRYLAITPQGKAYTQEMEEVKQQLEQTIVRKLGAEKVNEIKQILTEEWL